MTNQNHKILTFYIVILIFEFLILLSVLDATHRVAVGPATAAHLRTRAVEVQVASVGTEHRRTPVEAFAADNVERPIAAIPAAACG